MFIDARATRRSEAARGLTQELVHHSGNLLGATLHLAVADAMPHDGWHRDARPAMTSKDKGFDASAMGGEVRQETAFQEAFGADVTLEDPED